MRERIQKWLNAERQKEREEQSGTPQHAFIVGKITALEEVLRMLDDTSN